MTDKLLELVIAELVDSHAALRMAVSEFAKIGPLAEKMQATLQTYQQKLDAPIVNAAREVYGDEVAADLEKKGY